ncbi:MAG TPA: TonB-dependent receptor, partial [Rariglobus sp.]
DLQSLERRFVSAAFDWKVGDRLTLRLDSSYSYKYLEGTEPYWTAAAGVKYPAAPDSHNYYGQPFTFTKSVQHHVGGGFDWTFSPDIKVRSGYARHEGTTDLAVVNNTLSATPGAYTAQASAWEYPDVTTDGGYLLLDWNFATGPLDHALTAGFYGDIDERTNFRSSAGGWGSVTFPVMDLDHPAYYNTPPADPAGAKYTAGRTINRNFVVGDSINLGRRWTALLGVNRTTIADRGFNAAGTATTRYAETEVTPTASLIFKPRENLSFYVNYMESLEKGGTAPALSGGFPVVNAGEIMPPLMSEQYELGAKTRLGGVFLTAALFQIDKGLQYTDVSVPAAPVYVQDGRQVHRGLEFTATGRVLDPLTLFGGLTLLDPEVKDNASNPALEGKSPTNVAKILAKAYAEYDIGAPSGFILTGGVYYTGPQYVDNLNTDRIPGYTTADLGFRHETVLGGLPVITRVLVTNVTDKNYWLNSYYIGAPRTLRVSATVKF